MSPLTPFQLSFLAADRVFYEGECISLILPTSDGQYGVQAGHINMIAAIIPGVLQFRLPDDSVHMAAVSGGLMKMENNQVMILVETAESPEEIDLRRAERAAMHAREQLRHFTSNKEFRIAHEKMARELTRLKVKKSGLP